VELSFWQIVIAQAFDYLFVRGPGAVRLTVVLHAPAVAACSTEVREAVASMLCIALEA
jgi:hypothetical protein